ncbi:hypothetical protein E1258_09035 [Micromonospora sp. KC207]|uniref:hypothetical protein n=1 Tax=Micromonospora sp. KC207 TaxID=2530377 RepID=UPI0010492711|nr:hypothetical protein [Micromonospora sp. KC207]TDC64111.1 hypothetical protein E1258_09035 [Micromonospora sp. KC207]
MSSDAARTARQFGDGPLSRAAARVYTLIVVEVLLLLACLPGLVPLVLLDPDASNIPLYAACVLPLAPALSAALYALHHQRPDLTDLRPAAAFRRGYRINLAGVLRIWVPLLAWLTVVAVNLAHLDVAAVPRWWAVPLVGVAAVATLVWTNALVITSLFAFRARDVARLALHFAVRAPGVSLGTALLLSASAAVTAVTSEAVLALAGSVCALALLRVAAPMTATIQREFTE